MLFKRGIFCGLLWIVGSVYGLLDWNAGQKNINWLYIFALVLGAIQLIASFHYQKLSTKKFLTGCFAIEGIYYGAAMIYLLVGSTAFEEKIFGMLVGIFMLALIVNSIKSLHSKDNITKS